MTYSTEASKWSAFQFKDPFAADQFYVCNKITKVCCRPNCDMGGSNVAKDDIFFVESIDKITDSGFAACKFCLPEKYSMNYMNILDGSFVEIDLDLLVNTVKFVNKSISFIEPLMNEEEEKNAVLKANALKSSLGVRARNGDPLSPTSSSVESQEGSISKNDCNHLKLIDLACRHIALAALSTSGISNIENDSDIKHIPSPTPTSSSTNLPQDEKRGKRKRRGGVLGFKELASKSKLSPWHFHRVFKNITGVTPKSYGDRCWQFILKQERKEKKVSNRSSIIINSQIANPTLVNESGDENKTIEDISSRKRKGENIESLKSNKRADNDRKIYQRAEYNEDENLPTNVLMDGSSLSSSSPSTGSSSVSNAYSRFSSQSPIESDTFAELYKSPTEFQQPLASSLFENSTASDSQGLLSNHQLSTMQLNNNSQYDQTINSLIQSLQEQQQVPVQQQQTQPYHHLSNESQNLSNGSLNYFMSSNSLFDSSINSDNKNTALTSLNSANNSLSNFNLDELVSSSYNFGGKEENNINSSILNFDIPDLSSTNDDLINQQQLQYQLQLQQQMLQHQPSHYPNTSNQNNTTGLNTPRLFLDGDDYLFSNNFSASVLDNNCIGELY
ncbi:unnamed protein product [[Candida] boidinii]|uniref:Unnamed protein product n=1 Tax=Candida boidinii TaxID=5477 RepID=A0A9W6WD63_CANBO|nr:binding protein [[Candida] boidinii]OWB83315.1 binding protein [[Candida] boidinii]GME66720.1 unnamed protein product [[Candida] boidinii]GMF97815.1 unnamed protein product [[Candida] boidinii]